MSKAKQPPPSSATPSVDNRRARYEYHILESVEAGVVLTGTEIKSVRQGGVSLNEAYARLREGELWLVNMHVPPYKEGSFSNHEPRRPRKLLLHRDQIARLGSRAAEKGLTIVPLRLYFTRGKVKLEIGLAKGKKIWDKRRSTAERDAKRDLARVARR
ncbi:MAG: SsrA-binding protein SmpB [Candidatus Eremiobacteraeota bacterium]|nr:SsrA-binding protein SmpB [Candidatus Eremiobacteraeota bacterium]